MTGGLNTLAQLVLDFRIPDKEKQGQWIGRRPMSKASQAPCLKEAAKRIEEALQNKEKIIICGDYDCDGISATAILVDALRRMGADVGFYIPDRMKEGYGLQAKTVKQAKEKGYSLLITVDNGVKAFEAIEACKALDMDLIITDHHLMEEAPDALVVHPDLMESEFSSLCGAGVAYELVRALGMETDYSLILAGCASIADCMPVSGQTRSLIQEAVGLLQNHPEMHISALANGKIHTETDLAFQVIPKINAPGRLSDMANANNVVRYFLDSDPRTTAVMADQIIRINDYRKQLSAQMAKRAVDLANVQDPILFVMDSTFHEGLVGLAAGQLCSQFQKPAIAAVSTPAGIKGSMRAPAGYGCLDVLSQFDGFVNLGGHDQAAGFTINLQDLDRFKAFLRTAPEAKPAEKEAIPLDPALASVEQIEGLDVLRPFGTGFEEPEFIIEHPQIKAMFDLSQGRHRKFTLDNGLECLRFNQPSKEMSVSVVRIQAFVGTLHVSSYHGKKRPAFHINRIVYI